MDDPQVFFRAENRSRLRTPQLSPEASHHVENVLRLKAGDRIEVRDGLGNAWLGEISGLKKGAVGVRLLEERDMSVLESPVDISLALGLARSDLMDSWSVRPLKREFAG